MSSTPSFTELTVQTTDKYDIHVTKFAAKDAVKAQLVIVHGYLEHGKRYAEFAEYLTAHGITVFALDCRGHGKSQGNRAYCWNFEQYHLDLDAVLTAVDANLPLFILGHSAGGVVVLDYLRTHKTETLSKRWKGVIISSPFLGPADTIPAWKIWATRLLAYVAPMLTVPADEVTSEILTQDEGKRKEHDEDPLILYKASVGWGYGVQQTQRRILDEWQPPTVGDLPLLLAFGAADKVADPAKTRDFFQRIQTTDKTIDERADKYHEILNETDRQELYEQMKDWILARVK